MITALGAGLSAAGSIGVGLFNRWKDKRDQKEMLRYQNNLNLQNWNLQNAYNSPSAQMQRLKDAGLNPNLIYQQGGAMSQAGEIAAPSQTNFSQPVVNGSPFEMYMDLLSNQVEKGHLDNETQAIQNENEYRNALRQLTETNKKILDKELGWKDTFLYQQSLMNEYNNNVLNQTANKLQAETNLTQREVDTYYMRLNNTLMNDSVQRALGRENIDKIRSEISQINQLILKTKDERRILQLEYARGKIAQQVEILAADIEKDKYYWLNNDAFPEKQRDKSNLWRQLEADIKMSEVKILGNEISNVTNPLRDILLPAALFMIGRGNPRTTIQGFSKYLKK